MPEEQPQHASPEEEKRKKEEAEAEERSAPNPSVVWDAVHQEGVDELQRRPLALMWSGLAAGLSMGFSLIAEGLLRAHLPETEWRPLVSKLGYPVGFIIVVLGRQQLFTENTLTPILPLLANRDRAPAWVTEVGWSTCLYPPCVSQQQQAGYLSSAKPPPGSQRSRPREGR